MSSQLDRRTGASALTPWFWGINRATGVVASALAMAISIGCGLHNAGTSDGDPSQSCIFPAVGTNTVWYRFTPPRDGTITVRTFGSAFDTVVSAYTGSCNPIDNMLTEVACSDNVGSRLDSEISFPAVAGTPYLIMVGDGGDTAGANLRINIDLL